MDIIVCKFGGSSTASAAMFRRIRDILSMDARRRWVVLSAPGGSLGKVTDLLDMAWQAKSQGRNSVPWVERVVDRFQGIASELNLPPIQDVVRQQIEYGLSVSRAHTLSRGEYLCARLFANYAGLLFADAAGLLQFHEDGRLNTPETLLRIIALTRKASRAVIPGFYGTMPDGSIATLPRNGSDITGALVAAGVGATLYENWTDVPGLMTDDPANNAEAKRIPEITYAEMTRMARQGTRVLHPDCLNPVARAGIPTRICNTFDPQGPGTMIR